MSGGFYIGFLPWCLFDVMTRSGGLSITWGSTIALISAVSISLWRRKATSLDLLAIVLYSTILALALADLLPASIALFARAWSTGVLALFALASTRTIPFSQQFTRDYVARPIGLSTSFRQVNIEVSVTWGIVFSLIAASHAAGSLLNGPTASSVFHWLVPISLVIAGAYFSQRIWNNNIDESGHCVGEVLNCVAPMLESQPQRFGSRNTPLASPTLTVVRDDVEGPVAQSHVTVACVRRFFPTVKL